jgi:hypothetical protein
VQLSEVLGITHHLPMKPESSATFIYAVIDAYGGAYSFYRNFYVGSVCPLGFTREGNNCNYYDDPSLAKRMTPFIVASISAQVAAGADRKLAISLGEGKNYRFLSSLNDQHGWFEQIAALPHPRFVMQYKRKQLQQYLDKYLALLLEP